MASQAIFQENGFDRTAIPDIVVGRLPIYLRTLTLLADDGYEVTSSQELGRRLGISSAQIRKDLSHFGEFGKQGTGYNIAYLCAQLQKILKVDCVWPVVLVGAGNLGHALVSYNGFEDRGFRIAAVFDNSSARVGEQMGGLTVQGIDQVKATVERLHCRMGVIAVPASAAQEVADCLIEASIGGLLCYAPTTLKVPAHVYVQYIDPLIHFQHMAFYLEKGCFEDE